MSNMGGITVDVRGFTRDMKTFAEQYGVEVGIVMRNQMRLWGEDLIRNTPHKNAKRKAVNAAIKSQLEGIFGRMRPGPLRWFRQKLMAGDFGGNLAIFDEIDMAAHHKANRNPRTGESRSISGAVKLGPWTFSRKPYVTTAQFNKYVRTVQERVGKARAAWLPMAKRWGGRSPAEWILRHKSTSRGSTTDLFKTDGSGYLEGRGVFRYNANKMESTSKFTARKRQTDLEKHLKKRIRAVVAAESARR